MMIITAFALLQGEFSDEQIQFLLNLKLSDIQPTWFSRSARIYPWFIKDMGWLKTDVALPTLATISPTLGRSPSRTSARPFVPKAPKVDLTRAQAPPTQDPSLAHTSTSYAVYVPPQRAKLASLNSSSAAPLRTSGQLNFSTKTCPNVHPLISWRGRNPSVATPAQYQPYIAHQQSRPVPKYKPETSGGGGGPSSGPPVLKYPFDDLTFRRTYARRLFRGDNTQLSFGEDLLNKLFDAKGLEFNCVDVIGDGNCGPRAIARTLYGKEERYLQLKDLTLQYFLDNQDEVVLFINDQLCVQHHLPPFPPDVLSASIMEHLSTDFSWAECIHLQLYAMALNRQIQVFRLATGEVSSIYQPILPPNGLNELETLHLAHFGDYEIPILDANFTPITDSDGKFCYRGGHFLAVLPLRKSSRKKKSTMLRNSGPESIPNIPNPSDPSLPSQSSVSSHSHSSQPECTPISNSSAPMSISFTPDPLAHVVSSLTSQPITGSVQVLPLGLPVEHVFNDTTNIALWTDSLSWLNSDFDPEIFLTRGSFTKAPTGEAQNLWVKVNHAITLLMQRFDPNVGGPHQNLALFDKTFMLSLALPKLVLRVRRKATGGEIQKIQCKNCQRFLRGHWRSLCQEFIRASEKQYSLAMDLDETNTQHPQCFLQSSDRIDITLEHARNLQYSNAMRVLRSPGLASMATEQLKSQLDGLHPPRRDTPDTWIPLQYESSSLPKFGDSDIVYDALWARTVLSSGQPGKARDQWGWDMKEMWRGFLSEPDTLDLIAKYWFLPILTGNIPKQYAHILSGARLVPLSKAPKPGIRPIAIGDVRRRFPIKWATKKLTQVFLEEFQHKFPLTKQFCAAAPDGQHNLVTFLRQIETHCQTKPMEDPNCIVCFDVKNAFNCISRLFISNILSDPATPGPIRDLIWYFQAFYHSNGFLRVFNGGESFVVRSQEGLQQGDPISLPLFAYAIHSLLQSIVTQFPGTVVSAFADNVFVTCPLSLVPDVYNLLDTQFQAVGLSLNSSETMVYVPSHLEERVSLLPGVQQSTNIFVLPITTNVQIPVVTQGVKILGVPFGTLTYRKEVFSQIVQKISHDLVLLRDIDQLHIRSKLLIYCVNVRFDYFLGTDSFQLLLTMASELDSLIAGSVIESLHWDDSLALGEISVTQAIQQLRLPISRGGWGIRSIVHSTFSASAGLVFSFLKWLDTFKTDFATNPFVLEALTTIPFSKALYLETIQAAPDYNINLLYTAPTPQGDGKVVPFEGLPHPAVVTNWSASVLPTRQQIAGHLNNESLTSFKLTLSSAHCSRVQHLSRYSTPATQPASDLFPPDPTTADLSISHSPMSLMTLTCRQELSNRALAIVTCLQCGLSIPPFWLPPSIQSTHADETFDWTGHLILNKVGHSQRYSTHNRINQNMAEEFTNIGARASADPRQVPRALSASDGSIKADMILRLPGLCSVNRSCFTVNTDVLLDVSLVNSATISTAGLLKFNRTHIRAAERHKSTHYTAAYREATYAFLPLLVDYYGHIGSDALRLFHRIASVISRSRAALSSGLSSSPLAGWIFHSCRSRFLKEAFEATALRLVTEWGPVPTRRVPMIPLRSYAASLFSNAVRQSSMVEAPSLTTTPMFVSAGSTVAVNSLDLPVDYTVDMDLDSD